MGWLDVLRISAKTVTDKSRLIIHDSVRRKNQGSLKDVVLDGFIVLGIKVEFK